MLQWPIRARRSLAFLFQPLQDLDVYVEDTGDEVFYTELFRRIAPSSIRLVRIFSSGNRESVIEAAKRHDFARRPALFVIDGDFEWVRDEQPPAAVGLHRLPAYCVENLLIHEDATIQIIIEDAAIDAELAKGRFAFQQWAAELEESLLRLFVRFAVMNSVAPQHSTVGLGVGSVLKTSPGCHPELDRKKIEALCEEIESRVTAAIGRDESERLYAQISARVSTLDRSFDVISGKDFLLPLFEFRLWRCTGTKTKRKSLRVRLARHCNVRLFYETVAAIERACA